MSAYVITPPTSGVVSLAAAKANMAVDFSDDDRLIDRLIFAAQDWLADQYDISTGLRTLELALCGFQNDAVQIPLPPTVAIVSIKYDDADGVEQTMASDAFRLIRRSPSIYYLGPTYGASWPAARTDTGSVRIRYTAGYPTEADVPRSIQQAVLLLVGDWYANREASTVGQVSREIAHGVSRIMAPYRVWSV